MDYPGRQRRLLETLASQKLDILLVTHLPNVRYLCGFTGSNAVLAIGSAGPVFFTDGRYIEQAHTEVVGARVVITKKSALGAAGQWLAERAKRVTRLAVAIESEYLTLASHDVLKNLVPKKVRLKPTTGVVARQRMVKDAEEIAKIRDAALLAASVFDEIVKEIRPGVTETQVAAELEYAARCAGAEQMSFPTIIAAGPRSALPHARATLQAVPARGFVVMDFGVILEGYCSDMTRTVHVGRPNEEARQVYEAVREAQQAGSEAVRPGAAVGEVDRAARSVLRRAGLAKYFTHSTGHGVGLEIHEPPRVAAGQQEHLVPGMVITVEPGVYVAGSGGVRIEDMVVVTERGCEVLTPTTKKMIEV